MDNETPRAVTEFVGDLAMFTRGAMKTQGMPFHRLGSEPDDFGFVTVTLTHGLVRRLFELENAPPPENQPARVVADGPDFDGGAS